jgi:transcriptional regulator with XRE-family HTH domain
MNSSFKTLFAKIRDGLAYKQAKVKLDFTIQLETLMKKNGVTKADLARNIQKSGPYITKIMKGESNFTIESMVALADAVGGKIQIHIIPKEEEVVAWFKSLKTANPVKRPKQSEIVVQQCDAEKLTETDNFSGHFQGKRENGYSIAA